MQIFKAMTLGAAALALASCGSGYSSKVEELIESCWVPGLTRTGGAAEVKLGEIKITEEKITEAGKQNGITWAAGVLVNFTYRETPGGDWRNGMRMPFAMVREGKLRLDTKLMGVDCETDL